MNGDTLGLALALMQAPSMRMLLRRRPLPDDVHELIELAADVPGRAAAAAALSGQAPVQMLEAARFYVREVLLFSEADAYRVLGVAPAASARRIKEHHRLLQRWLHPDRRHGDWESVFATRVNAAWAELRTPARRAAYDARLRAQGAVSVSAIPRRILIRDPPPEAVKDEAPRERWWLAAAVAVCLALVALIGRQVLAPAPEWAPTGGREDEAVERGVIAATVDAAAEQFESRWRDPEAGERTAPATLSVDLPAPAPRPPAPLRDAAPVPVPVALPRMQAANAHGQEPEQAVAAGVTPAAVIVEDVDLHGLAVDAVHPVPPGAGPDQAPIEAAAPPARAAEEARAVSAGSIRTDDPAPPSVEGISLERVRLVRRSGGELIRYLGSASGPAPPIWRSGETLDAATAIRHRLDGGSRHFGEPDWTIGADRARMVSTLRSRDGAGARAVLRAEFAWTEGGWLLDRLRMDASETPPGQADTEDLL